MNGFLLLSLWAWSLFTKAGSSPLPPDSRQLLLVLTPSYEATQGFLYKFQRGQVSLKWERVADAIPIVVGRSGLGWGEGMHDGIPPDRPLKREGDGRSPAGVFNLSSAFGFAAAQEIQPLHFPYVQITTALECVDDSRSRYYNTLVDGQKVDSRDWHSSEKMFEIKTEYRLGVFVDHNTHLPRPDLGSCIFLHIWSSAGHPTSGCTAMAAPEMEKIVHWLDENARPILVQLPQAEYAHWRASWQLPDIAPFVTPAKMQKAAKPARQQ